MKLAFSGEAKYPEFDSGYELYCSRSRSRECISKDIYKKIVREYCRSFAEQLKKEGMADLPGIGSIAAVSIRRKLQYRGKKVVGYGKMDWKKGYYDGSPTAFGIAFLPNRKRSNNLRCYGFVANRKLFQTMKEIHDGYECPWVPLEFKDEMI